MSIRLVSHARKLLPLNVLEILKIFEQAWNNRRDKLKNSPFSTFLSFENADSISPTTTTKIFNDFKSLENHNETHRDGKTMGRVNAHPPIHSHIMLFDSLSLFEAFIVANNNFCTVVLLVNNFIVIVMRLKFMRMKNERLRASCFVFFSSFSFRMYFKRILPR